MLGIIPKHSSEIFNKVLLFLDILMHVMLDAFKVYQITFLPQLLAASVNICQE